ncbi:protein translocase subunit SecF [Anaeromyxobacter sp. Fw109-5]|uniref:protein translocase subunit SecF n=1 Tax=Anaeromyxobacter sp. (strain Fw109-5) TaxID=404589 RepID=UPI0000ED7CFD|nr:protein translocase subunit SecF [Anaeromyxobacter sp. Fw109-5]ABS25532.1 protein-export membrane protein SecF [Anaeromyxobacter sp. Fw109-5]
MRFKSFDIVPHGTKFDFVGKRHIAVVLSLIVNAAVLLWAVPAIHGLNFGVDFAGGTEMEVKFAQPVDAGAIRKSVEDLGFKGASVQTYGDEEEHAFLIRVERIALMGEEDVKRVVDAVQAKFPVERWSFNPEIGDKIDFEFKQPPSPQALQAAVEGAGVGVREVRAEQGLAAGTRSFAVITQGIREKIERDLSTHFAQAQPEVRRVEYVGPAVGRELRNQGFKAVLYAMALIVVYVGLRFDFRFSPGVIIAILHDAIVTLGYFAFTGREFNLTSIAVLLTVVGYSVNDTVVVYDRIRENQAKYKGKSLAEIVNLSINETLGRTFLTSFATALSLVGLLVYGVGTLFDFSAAMLVGIVSGTYSTWFIAAPMTIWFEERAAKKKASTPAAAAPSAPGRAAQK